MTSNFLIDEHLPLWLPRAVEALHPQLTVWRVGDPGAPPLGSTDPTILDWCETHDFVLVTNNRKSMPTHLRDHLAVGRHVPGILAIGSDVSVNELAGDLILIFTCMSGDELLDRIEYLPL